MSPCDKIATYVTPYGERVIPPHMRGQCYVRAIRKRGRADMVAVIAYAERLLDRYMRALCFMFWKAR